MKVGILTLPLHANYGGVLQAFALQYSLRSMGHDAYLIDCRVNPAYANIIKRPAACVAKLISTCLPPLAPKLSGFQHQMLADKALMRRNVNSFIDKYIPCCHFISYNLIPRHAFSVIVVGSDQVWRPQYFRPIGAAFLDFAARWSVKRIAYATSFGVDNWEYTPSQSAKCRDLISKFDAVSVRESSAVNLCAEHLNCSAVQVLDPTLLLAKDVYVDLVERADALSPSAGDMMVAILDRDQDKTTMVDSLAAKYVAKPFSVNSRVEDRSAPLEERIQPPVEQWLKGFMDARYVVTDSYHACIFAIIFNKPFVAYGNGARGRARFESLLSQLGLINQYVESAGELNLDNCFNIDWCEVNSKLAHLKFSSLNFLHSAFER